MSLPVALGLLLLPVACFALALWWTRELVSDDPLPTARWGPGAWLSFVPLTLLVLVFTLAPIVLRTATLGVVALSACLPAAAWTVRRASKRRRACRQLLWGLVGMPPFLVYMACGSTLAARHLAVRPLFDPGWLPAAASAGIAFLVVLTPPAHATSRGARVWIGVVLGLLALWLASRAWPSELRDVQQLAAYARDFDAPVDEMVQWEDFGRTVAFLRERGLAPPLDGARRRIDAAVAGGVKLNSDTALGALRAGLLKPAQLERVQATLFRRSAELQQAWRADVLQGEGPLHADPVELRVLIEAGGLDAAQRRHLAERLALSFPAEPAFGDLEDARAIQELLLLLDARDLLLAHREELRALLQRTWCASAPSFMAPGGFSRYDPAEDHGADDRSNLDALDLMREVGVPEGVDLVLFEAHLDADTSGYRARLADGHGYLWLKEHLAWHRLHAEHEVRYSAAQALQRWHLPVAVALLLLFAAWVVWRAPVVQVAVPPKRVPKFPWLRA